MVVLNLARLLFHSLLVVLWWFGEIPWWTAPMSVLYDLSFAVIVKLPWVKVPIVPPQGLPPIDVEEAVNILNKAGINVPPKPTDGPTIH